MTKQEINNLKKGLALAKDDVKGWGRIQNNEYDNELKSVCDIFTAYSYKKFKEAISSFDDDHQNYYITRWFRLMGAKYDEYLFSICDNCTPNPQKKDKKWDVQIGDFQVDIKGTRPFKDMTITDIESVDNEALIQRFYDSQSKGVRYDIQNRLFLIHYSMVDEGRENEVRCNLDFKEQAIAEFCHDIDNVRLYPVLVNGKTVLSTVLWIVENADGSYTSYYPKKSMKWDKYYHLPEIEEIRQKIIDTYTNKLIFYEGPHEYYLDGVQYMCVSDVTHKYKPSSSDQMAEGCVKKWQKEQDPSYKYYGMSKKEILALWKVKSDHACEFGTDVHAFGESMFYYMTGQPDKILPECAERFRDGYPHPSCPQEEAIVKFWNDLPETFVPVLAETKVFNRNGTPYAGTFDILFYYVNEQDRSKSGLVIFDYKTNEDLFKNFRGQKLLWPFNDLLDQNASYYTLQLSLYAIPLENLGLKVVGRRLIWVKPDGTYEKVKIEPIANRLRDALNIPTAKEIIEKNIL